MSIEWQGYGDNTHVHAIDTERPPAKRSGIRAFCGRYPGKTFYSPWWAVNVGDPGLSRALSHYGLQKCPGCQVALEDSMINPEALP
jgi:hypothetical protein